MTFHGEFTIAPGVTVGRDRPPIVIAEGGVNHFGDVSEAMRLADLAKSSGCDVFKLQHYYVNELVHPSNIEWRNRLETKQLRIVDVELIKRHCDDIGIPFLCTGHDLRALEELVQLCDVPSIKIGSGEIFNYPYLKAAASYQRPILLSTGMHSLLDIADSIAFLRGEGVHKLAIFHCVTAYPIDKKKINLNHIRSISNLFEGPVGWSDHTVGNEICLAAVAIGASIVEKHITLQKNVPNAQDWKVSADAYSLPELVASVRNVWRALNSDSPKPLPEEREAHSWAVKSAYYSKDIEAGSALSPDNIVMLRGSVGTLTGRDSLDLFGRRLRRQVQAGEAVSVTDFE